MKYAKLASLYFLVFLVGISLTIIGVSAYNIATNRVNVDIPRLFMIESGSMEPALKVGSIAVTLPSNSYRPGDIITFYPEEGQEKNIVTHRVSKIENNTIITKGDANEEEDRWTINKNQIIGKVIFSAPYLGRGVSFAKDPRGFILMVIVPSTIIIYEELKNIVYEITKFAKKTAKTGITKIAIIIPAMGFLLIAAAVSGAYFFDLELSASSILGASHTFSPVVINEFLPDPSSPNDETEWIELYNRTNSSISLDGWILDDNDGTPPFVLDGRVIAANSYLVVEKSESGIGLNNSGDSVRLLQGANLKDSIKFGIIPTDQSYGRSPDGDKNITTFTIPTKNSANP